MSIKAIFIFGLGYVGQHFGRSLMAEGWKVRGTTRTNLQAQNLRDQGFEAYVWDVSTLLSPEILQDISHILVTIPPDEEGDIVLRHFEFSNKSYEWIGYLSATSVYGDHGGAWVREEANLKPTSSQGRHRLLAETQWLQKRSEIDNFPIHIFRLSGIYGPGRNVLESIRSGSVKRIDNPKDKQDHVFSRIHIEDIILILKASIANPQFGEIYNLADDEPTASADVIAYGCELLKVKVPPLTPFEEAALSEKMKEFYLDHKRVSNDKIKRTFNISLKFPSFREGLKHC